MQGRDECRDVQGRDECRDMQGRVEAGMCRAGMRQGCAGQG